ncbi:MAG TPA: hypothetical protein VGF19_11175 [Candidatus Acidoferrum sp.]|jgi:hypothetical protein
MSLIEALPLVATTLVEVSGWDEDELFFVEKSAMTTDEFECNYISLRHHLPDGAIIFVRSIQSAYLHRPNPIAFEVESLGYDADGQQQFRLSAAQPRHAQSHYSVN